MDDIDEMTLRFAGEVPGFLEAVERAAASTPPKPVTVALDRFGGAPLRVYACLELARRSGVPITFDPGPREAPHGT